MHVDRCYFWDALNPPSTFTKNLPVVQPTPCYSVHFIDYTVSVHVRAIYLLHWLCVSHQDVIAHSGDKGKKGVTSTKAAAKQVLVCHTHRTLGGRVQPSPFAMCAVPIGCRRGGSV